MNQKVREQPKAKLLEYLTKHEQELSKIFKDNKQNGKQST
jgi:hypothetical protein